MDNDTQISAATDFALIRYYESSARTDHYSDPDFHRRCREELDRRGYNTAAKRSELSTRAVRSND